MSNLNIANALSEACPGLRFLDSPAQRLTYERDANVLLSQEPALIALPESAEEVAQVVRACIAHQIPYTTRGAGTGLAAGSVPHAAECLLISTARMKRIHHIDSEAQRAQVEAGCVNARLNEALAPHGLMYAPDPSSQKACTLGGNWAANAGGVHCIGYGVTMDHVLALRLVNAQGELFWTSPPNGVAGPTPLAQSWNGLYVGSEGTLGILCEAVVKLTPVPQHVGVALLGFASVSAAMKAVAELAASGLNPKAVEFMDAITVRCVNQSFGVGLPHEAQGVVLIELAYHYPEELPHAHARLNTLIQAWQPLSSAWETAPARREQLWQARKGAVASYGQLSPMFYVLDSVIPRHKLPEVLAEMEAISARYGLPIANVFHAGDGNLHPHLMFADNTPETIARVESAASEIFQLCLTVGGVLSGEHGIGLEKLKHMDEQFDAQSLAAQQSLKLALDEAQLANRGKSIPMKGFCGEAKRTHSRGLSTAEWANQALWI